MDEIGPAPKDAPPGFTVAEKVVLGLILIGLAGGLSFMAWINSFAGQGHPL